MSYHIETGDWVRFYNNGRLVIGQVEYIVKSKLMGFDVKTDIGSVHSDYVLEVRKPSGGNIRGGM